MRKLATFAFSFSLAVFLSVYIMPTSWALPVISAVFFVGVMAAVLLKEDRRLRVVLICLGFALGLVWFFAYNHMFYKQAAPYDGQKMTVSAEVSDYPEYTDYGMKIPIKVTAENGEEIKTLLYVYQDISETFLPGDTVQFTGSFHLSYKTSGDESKDFIAKGYQLRANTSGDVKILESPGMTLEYMPRFVSHALKEKIAEIFPERTKGFALAILTGDRTELYQDNELTNAMTVSGVLHIVAVSGMHVVFLVGFLMAVFGKRRFASLIAIPVVLFFMAIIGFTPSVTRAGIMQIFILVAPLIKRESDTITALSFALLLLLCLNPFSAASIGLQLSFTSSLGILLFTSKMYKAMDSRLKNTKLYDARIGKAAARFVIGSFSTTIGALILSLPVSAVYFEYISLIAPLTNLLVLWAAAGSFCVSIAASLLGFLFTPLGVAGAAIASVGFEYMTAVVQFLAKFPLASIYTANVFVIYWLLYVYCVLGIFIALRGNLHQLILPGSFGIISLCIILIVTSVSADRKDLMMTVLDVGQGQSLVFTSQTATAVVDCGSSNGDYAGDTAADYVKSLGRNKVDLLILTHFHTDHTNGVDELAAQIEVSAIAMPEPFDEEDAGISEEILEYAEEYGIEVIQITEDTAVRFGQSEMTLYAPLGSESENEKGLSVLCTWNDFDILVTGDMSSHVEKLLIASADLPDIEVLVVGHHGSKYSTSEELLDAVKPEVAVISVGRNTYGHPTNEVLERLGENSIEVYRTDISGNVTINAG